MRQTALFHRNRGRAGMTIVEIMIVVTIIGILAVLAIPQVQRARMRSQNTAFLNDLRLLSDGALSYFSFTHGGLPPDSAPGVLPPEILECLPKRFDWAAPTSIGGQWDWQRGAAPTDKVDGICYAGIAVSQPARTQPELAAIDAMIDDGNLSTGMFRSTPDGCMYVLEF